MDLSFSGAGFMGCYYIGVVSCWNKYVPKERVNRVAGASAGSLIAAYYLMDIPLKDCLKEIIDMSEDIRRRPLGVFDRSNQVVDILPKLLDKLFPEDAHKRVSGRLHVCMTRLKDMKKIIVNEFETRKDLIDALNCSCFIPVWSGNHVSTYKGIKYIDGGFSDNLPVFDEHTIRICCFSGATDISPYDRAKMELLSGTVLNTPLYLNFANCRRFRKALFPPPASYIIDLLERGFHDTKDFILSNDLIQCNSCYGKTAFADQPIFTKLSPMITPRVSPAPSRAGSYMNLSEPANCALVNKSGRCLTVSSESRNRKSSYSSFNTLLLEKLSKSESANDTDTDNNNNNNSNSNSNKNNSNDNNNNNSNTVHALMPTIVIDDIGQLTPEMTKTLVAAEQENTTDGCSSPDSLSEANLGKKSKPLVNNEKFLNRKSLQAQPGSLLAIEDKFTLAPNPLPSCPPSPNLNRHCSECISMRHEARLDLIQEEVRAEAEKYRKVQPIRDNKLKNKLTSPLRWIRQIGVKSSYKFADEPPTTLAR